MRPSLACSTCALLLLACAGSKPLPPGDELEDAPRETVPAAAGEISAPAQASPDELEAAFSAPKAKPPAPPPQPAPAVAPAAPAEPPAVARRAPPPEPDAAGLLAKARGALRRKEVDELATALEALKGVEDALQPRDAQQTAELAFKLAALQKDAKEARKAAERWLLTCGPDRVESCRAAALSASLAAARLAGPDVTKAAERVALIRKNDACVRQAETRGGNSTPPCLEPAMNAYRRGNDRLMLARSLLARGLRLATDPARTEDALNRVGQAETACEERRCAAVRRRALKAMAQLHQRKGELGPAASALLKEMELAAQALPEGQRTYARTPDVERVCERLDEAQGAGSCRKLELQLLGHYTFRDFSRGRAAGMGLSPGVVKQVNEHYGVTLRPCLEAEAANLRPPASVTYRVEWTVTNEGRVEKAHLEKKDKDEGPFGECLREGFRVWRYPQYRGEFQHVEQAFVLQARERRSSNP